MSSEAIVYAEQPFLKTGTASLQLAASQYWLKLPVQTQFRASKTKEKDQNRCTESFESDLLCVMTFVKNYILRRWGCLNNIYRQIEASRAQTCYSSYNILYSHVRVARCSRGLNWNNVWKTERMKSSTVFRYLCLATCCWIRSFTDPELHLLKSSSVGEKRSTGIKNCHSNITENSTLGVQRYTKITVWYGWRDGLVQF